MLPLRHILPPGLLLCALLLASCPAALTAQVRINEVLASNESVLADDDGSHHDWIELYNPGPLAFDLLGSYISDDPAFPLKHQFQGSLLVPPQGFLLLWASGSTAGGDQLPFSLSMDGDNLLLTAGDGLTLMDQLQFGGQQTNVSYGTMSEGSSDWRFFPSPTPLASNTSSTGLLAPVAAPSFSVPPGYHGTPVTVHIAHPDPEAIIYYTLDGSGPDPLHVGGLPFQFKNSFPGMPGEPFGPLLNDTIRAYPYSAPIVITDPSALPNVLSARTTTYTSAFPPPYMPTELVRKGTVVKARAFKPGHLPGPVITGTYFIEPSGPPYALPVLSLSVSRRHLFDYQEGLYTAGWWFDQWRTLDPVSEPYGLNPANWHLTTEVPAGVEWFEEGATAPSVSVNAGLRLHGGFSRSLKRKSLRLYFRSLYGASQFEHPLFPAQEHAAYKRLIVHNSGNDEGLTNMRDLTLQAMARHMRNETMDARPANVFINGEYWGVHALRERYDRHYFERVHAIPEGQLDLLDLQNVAVIEGDVQHYQAMVAQVTALDMGQDASYEQIASLLDPEDFIDHHITHLFTGNTDWPQNNVRIYRKRTDAYVPGAPHGHDGRWRWLTFDLDHGFNLTGEIHANLPFLNRVSLVGGDLDPAYTLLFRRLLLNTRFRELFINRTADMLNTAFRTPVTTAIIIAHRGLIAQDMQEHFARWTDGPGSNAAWTSAIDTMLTFAAQRPAALRAELMERFGLPAQHQLTVAVSSTEAGYVRINTIDILPATHGVEPVPYPWSGTYFQDVPITLRAVALPGHQFLYWTGGVESTSAEVTLSLTGALSVTAVFGEAPFCEEQTLHAWHFNDLPSGTLAGVQADGGTLASGTISYSGSGPGTMDRTAGGEGTSVNAEPDVPPGRALRVRNPSAGRHLLIAAPATGYRDIVLSYATMRTSNGPHEHQVWYSVDPAQEQWVPLGGPRVVTSNYVRHVLGLDGVAEVYDDPHLVFRIGFSGEGVDNSAGNSRFDNVRVSGRPLEVVEAEFCAEAGSYLFNEVEHDAPGSYLHLIEGAMDCSSHTLLRLAPVVMDTTVVVANGSAQAAAGADAYQWLDCETGHAPIEGADQMSFVPGTAGWYAVEMERSGCSATSACHFVDPDDVTGIAAYPNPVQDLLHVQLIDPSRYSSYHLYQSDGRLVREGMVSSSRFTVAMSDLAAGAYTLELRGRQMVRLRIVR
jgi:hypothetical protein